MMREIKNKKGEIIMTEKDPYALTQEEAKRMKEEDKFGMGGIICPKRNVAIRKTCNVCNRLQKVYAAHVKGDKMWNLANKKNSKPGYFICAVLKENPSKAVMIELFKKAGNIFMDKAEAGEWDDISILQAGKGRDVRVSKHKDDSSGYNVYPVEIMPDKADWSVEQEAIDSLPHFGDNLKQAQEVLMKILEEDSFPILRVSSLKIDSSVSFRIARRPGEFWIVPLYRHWGNVTQEEVDGKVEMDLELMDQPFQERKDDDVPPWEKQKPEVKEELGEPQQEKKDETKKNPACFGMENFFDMNDTRCKECYAFSSCGKEAMNK